MTLTTDLTGRVALVTGASSGFGHRFARVLAASGAEVIVAARRASALEELVAEITAAGGKARAAPLDVTDPAAIAETISALPALDIVINNAGVAGESIAIDCEADEWRWTYDVNVHGAWFVAQQAAQKMAAARTGGSIINISSVGGKLMAPSTAAYAASKAGLHALTAAMAGEVGQYGIRVNAICPGIVSTSRLDDLSPAQWEAIINTYVPLKRAGAPAEIGSMVVYLCSKQGEWISGQFYSVDGGQVAGR